jgi:hypothetical protein
MLRCWSMSLPAMAWTRQVLSQGVWRLIIATARATSCKVDKGAACLWPAFHVAAAPDMALCGGTGSARSLAEQALGTRVPPAVGSGHAMGIVGRYGDGVYLIWITSSMLSQKHVYPQTEAGRVRPAAPASSTTVHNAHSRPIMCYGCPPR